MIETVYDKFISIFGEYQPVVTEFSDGTSVTDINWAYIGSVVAFLVLFYCALRILGAVICRDK